MLLTMAVFDTPENKRSWMTNETLQSLEERVDWNKHRLMISDNGSHEYTHNLYQAYTHIIDLTVFNGENIGTANALNKLWRLREPGEAVCKIDNDVVIHRDDWPDLIEMVFDKAPDIGICGLKRRDLQEWPTPKPTWQRGMEDYYMSKLRALPHKTNEPWLIVEEVNHVMGTCQAYRPELLDKIGYLYQPGVYGFDDSLAATRCRVAGFKNTFLHGVEIDHIDPGGTAFIEWKKKEAGRTMEAFYKARDDYQKGLKDIYFNGGFE